MGRKNSKGKAKVISTPAPSLISPGRRIMGAPMTRDEYTRLAQEVAHKEISAVAQELAAHIHKGVQQSMDPLGKRFADLYHKCNELDIHIRALVEVLNDKDLLSKQEVRVAAEKVTNALVARQELLKTAMQEKQAVDAAQAEAKGEATAVGATPRASAPAESDTATVKGEGEGDEAASE